MALAGGNIASDGPKVVSATTVNADTLAVKVAHDQSAGFAALDPEAAAGVGWIVGGATSAILADSVQVASADTLLIHFTGAVPTDGSLYYGYGYGRLAGTNQPAQGNGIYDLSGLPIWTLAPGVKVNAPVLASVVEADAVWMG